jgi:hypothetical protein
MLVTVVAGVCEFDAVRCAALAARIVAVQIGSTWTAPANRPSLAALHRGEL